MRYSEGGVVGYRESAGVAAIKGIATSTLIGYEALNSDTVVNLR